MIAADRGDLNSGKNGFEADSENFAQDWTLEATGNWSEFDEDADGNGTNELEQTRAHNEANETGTISEGEGQTAWADPVHDAAGNMITLPKPSDLANSISAKYDAWNRLVEVKDGTHVVAEFEYDGTGRRVLKIYDSQSPGSPDGVDACEHYLHSGQQVIETRQDDLEGGEAPVADSIEPTYQNVWSPRYIDSLILRDADEQRVFYLADANYNVTALIGEVEVEPEVFEWQPVERYLYTPYGVVTILDADFTDDADGVSDYNNTTLYTGREYNPETGLYYYRARYYHAELGKFIGRDPIGYLAGDSNLYRFVRNRPCVLVDPFGTRDQLPIHILVAPAESKLGEEENILDFREVRISEVNMSRIGARGRFFRGFLGMAIAETENLGDILTKSFSIVQRMQGSQRLRNDVSIRNCDVCIRILEIDGHGSWKRQYLHSSRGPIPKGEDAAPRIAHVEFPANAYDINVITAGNVKQVGVELKKLPWCSRCTIILGGCNTGIAKNAWPQILADVTGCRVVGSGGYSRGAFYSGDKEITKYLPPPPGGWDQFWLEWYDVRVWEREDQKETTDHYASEDDKFYYFTPTLIP